MRPIFLVMAFGIASVSAMEPEPILEPDYLARPGLYEMFPATQRFPSLRPEAQPPTERDWYVRSLRRSEKGRCVDGDPKPVWIVEPIRYYCPPGGCGPRHPSFDGQYGTRHPAPYYIPAPKLRWIPPGADVIPARY